MSAKGGKRISVFDRLGPGNDEDLHASSTHRRISTEKHTEKRHSASGRGRHYHADEDFSEEDVGKVKPSSSKKKIQEVGPKELFGKPPEKVVKIGPRGEQPLGEAGLAESEGTEEGRKKRSSRLGAPEDKKEEKKDSKISDKKEKPDRHLGAGGPSDTNPHARSSTDSAPHPRAEEGGHKKHSKDEEVPDGGSRHDRKRKRESSEDEKDGLESKKARIGDERSNKKNRGSAEESEENSKKRKKDSEETKMSEAEPRPSTSSDERRTTAKDCETVGSDRRSRGQDSSSSARRVREKERKGDGAASSDSDGETADAQKSDWCSLPSLLLEFPLPKVLQPLEQFSPAAVLMRSGISPYLAGPDLYRKAVEVVSLHLKTKHSMLPQPVISDPFGPPSFGNAGVTHLESQLELGNTYMECGGRPSCKALTMPVDCGARARLKKHSSKVLLPSQAPTSWEASVHYKSAVSLYRAAEGSSSKCKLKESVVGSVLVVR